MKTLDELEEELLHKEWRIRTGSFTAWLSTSRGGSMNETFDLLIVGDIYRWGRDDEGMFVIESLAAA